MQSLRLFSSCPQSLGGNGNSTRLDWYRLPILPVRPSGLQIPKRYSAHPAVSAPRAPPATASRSCSIAPLSRSLSRLRSSCRSAARAAEWWPPESPPPPPPVAARSAGTSGVDFQDDENRPSTVARMRCSVAASWAPRASRRLSTPAWMRSASRSSFFSRCRMPGEGACRRWQIAR
jgi:hypothetical protein